MIPLLYPFSLLRPNEKRKKTKTYNRKDSLVVTDSTTNLSITGEELMYGRSDEMLSSLVSMIVCDT